MKIIIPAIESESISSNILGCLQAPTQKAIEMDTLARNAMKKRSCPNLPMLECNKDTLYRSANLRRPYQVRIEQSRTKMVGANSEAIKCWDIIVFRFLQ